jgi:hypothetical protein
MEAMWFHLFSTFSHKRSLRLLDIAVHFFAGANLKPGILTMVLRNIWAHLTGTLGKTGTHSLNCTALSMLANAGANAEHKSLLGHQSSARVRLSFTHENFCRLLRQIRVRFLRPDKTRSGILHATAKQRELLQGPCRRESTREQRASPF